MGRDKIFDFNAISIVLIVYFICSPLTMFLPHFASTPLYSILSSTLVNIHPPRLSLVAFAGTTVPWPSSASAPSVSVTCAPPFTRSATSTRPRRPNACSHRVRQPRCFTYYLYQPISAHVSSPCLYVHLSFSFGDASSCRAFPYTWPVTLHDPCSSLILPSHLSHCPFHLLSLSSFSPSLSQV
jgi:hypothetical protein